MQNVFILVSALALAAGPDEALNPWSANTHPSDVPKLHVEEITAGHHQYTIDPGRHDGRPQLPLAHGLRDCREGAMLQTWESNRSVRMENVGETDVVNPWLSNGRNNFRNVEEIVSSAVTPDMTEGGKGLRALVPGNPLPPPFPGRQQRTRRSREGLQRLRVQHLRQRFHLPGDALAQGRTEGGAGPGPRTLHFPGVL